MDNNTHDMEPFHNINEGAQEIDEPALTWDLSSMEEEDGYEEAESPKTTTQGCFTVLTESKIKQLQEEATNEVSSVLLIPKSEACLLLTHNGWSTIKVCESWFDDEARTRQLAGLLLNDPRLVNLFNSNIDLNLTCKICFDKLSCKKMKSARCGHFYCTDCWAQYVNTKIQDGPNHCLKLRCPDPKCGAAVDGDMIRQFASESNKNKYDHFLLRSFVESSKNIKWCPSPGCEFAILYEPDGANYNYLEATCLCYHSFCWKCGEDAHRPMSCETVSEWITKNQTEFESTLWIFTNTKPCPGCNNPIEKNQGCMHMICTLCGFDFCWPCLHKWRTCSTNHFSEERLLRDENESELETRRKKAKGYLDKYTHYYERWASNEFSRKKALETMVLHVKKDKNIRNMCESYKRNEAEFEFLSVAWGQVIECRRVLKWTYAYGYFIPKDEEAKKEFFEHTQGVAENALEKLHQYAEKVLKIFLNGKKKGWFDQFRSKLMHLTDVTRKFFENLVRALENNELDDVSVKSYGGVKKLGSLEIGESSKTPRGDGGCGDRRTIDTRKRQKEGYDWWLCQTCGNFNAPNTTKCAHVRKL